MDGSLAPQHKGKQMSHERCKEMGVRSANYMADCIQVILTMTQGPMNETHVDSLIAMMRSVYDMGMRDGMELHSMGKQLAGDEVARPHPSEN